jgi:hypothetical protein
MRRAVLALSVVLLALSIDSSADRAAAIAFSLPAAATTHDGRLQTVGFDCRCVRAWGPRHYWQWDHRPVWDNPWQVLRPTIWGSPEPHLVPAGIWACKWHMPSARYWRRHRRQCRR